MLCLTLDSNVLEVQTAGITGLQMARRKRSKRKPNFYVKPPRTADQVQERMRQSRAAGKHKHETPPRKHEILKQEDQDNG